MGRTLGGAFPIISLRSCGTRHKGTLGIKSSSHSGTISPNEKSLAYTTGFLPGKIHCYNGYFPKKESGYLEIEIWIRGEICIGHVRDKPRERF